VHPTAPPHPHAAARCFDRWRQEYNTLRLHEALADATPAPVYRASPRRYPARLPSLEYPGHYEVCRLSRNGGMLWRKD
jgi:transposase InsO family protein